MKVKSGNIAVLRNPPLQIVPKRFTNDINRNKDFLNGILRMYI